MTIVFNYVTDYGKLVGFYPTITPVNLLDFLPDELRQLYFEQNNFQGCRTNELTPRKVRLNFDGQRQDIELPVTPTIEQLKVIKSNSSAIYVETIGEQIKYSRLRWEFNG